LNFLQPFGNEGALRFFAKLPLKSLRGVFDAAIHLHLFSKKKHQRHGFRATARQVRAALAMTEVIVCYCNAESRIIVGLVRKVWIEREIHTEFSSKASRRRRTVTHFMPN
jgi:hypothetical protein